ncbi:MAG: fatty acid desaturase CarF family protein [Aureliella sp.]
MFAFMFGTVILAYLAADFIAGFFHWLEDRYFDEAWPIIGSCVTKPNNLHHVKPTAFLEGNYWQRNWTTIVPAGLAVLIAAIFESPFWMLTFTFVSQANEIHAWAHSKGKVSRFIDVMQSVGILQSPKHHAVHHRSPFDVHYCPLTNWLNPILDEAGFWLRLERLVFNVSGLKPKSGQRLS